MYRVDLLMTVVKETSKYKLDLQRGRVAPNQQANIHFLWKGD
jgi:hypothetical protein